jgi:myo-inositol-1(or 4)-monophosphatase
MKEIDPARLLKTAEKAARACGRIMLANLDKPHSREAKGQHYNIVTETDKACEKAAVSIIRRAFPDHNILAEENSYEPTGSGYTWIIDPLDGTINFSHGLPCFAVSIACAKAGTVQAGIVFDPVSRERYSAVKGRGAARNGRPIRVSRTGSLRESLLITGFYYNRGPEMVRALEDMKEFLFKGIMGIRRFGSAALDLCRVACGRADGYWEFFLNPWDFAAGKLIVEEAGGHVTDGKGGEVDSLKPSYIVSSNGLIHAEMLGVLGK